MDVDQNLDAVQPQTKRARIEEPTSRQSPVAATSAEDADDFYDATEPSAPLPRAPMEEILPQNKKLEPVQSNPPNGIPGLVLIGDVSQSLPKHINGTIGESKGDDEKVTVESRAYDQIATSDTVKIDQDITIEPATNSHNQSNGESTAPSQKLDGEVDLTEDSPSSQTETKGDNSHNNAANAGMAQKEVDGNDEYEFTSSSEDSDTSSSESESSDEDEEGFPLMTAEEQVQILMREEVGEENDTSNNKIVRTEHEIVDEQVKKPEVVVTESMNIVQLGVVETIVGNVVLIKANKPGDFQVLESDSVLCLEDRTVIGAVLETLGRVQEPLYSVAFSTKAEIGEMGIDLGTTIYYVEDHSTYVFTQPLKATKGTDASNQHDEEPNPDEMEFSDDEAEAEYRRNLKRDKKAKRGQRTSVEYRGNGFATSSGAINYDDGDVDDGLYEPLARPANLHEMIQSGRAPLEEPRQRRPNERRRGNLRGRFNRVNSNQGRNSQIQSDERNPNIRSDQNFPIDRRGQEAAFGRNIGDDTPYSPEEPLLSTGYLPQRAGPDQNFAEQGSPQNTPVSSSFYPNQAASGHAAIYHGTNWLPFANPPPMSPNPGIPPGAHVNPAFYANYQTSQGAWPNPYQYQSMWSPPLQNFQQTNPWNHMQQAQNITTQAQQQTDGRHISPESDLAFRAAQERLDILRKLSGGGGGGSATSP